jgi:AraC-like DNA-binding protein
MLETAFGAASMPADAAVGNFNRRRGAQRFEAADIETAQQHLHRCSDGRARVTLGSQRQFSGLRHVRADLGRTVIETWELDVDGPHEVLTTPPREADLFLYIPRRGAIEIVQEKCRTQAKAGQIAVVSPAGRVLRKRWSGPSDTLCVIIDRPTMMKMLADEYGLITDSFLEFEPQLVADLERVPTLWSYIQMLCRDLDQKRPCVADMNTARACERTLLMLAVQSFPNDLSTRLQRLHSPAAPYYVRRVEEFIRTNAARDIAVSELTSIAGVSARSLYYGFEKHLGMAPVKYLKRVRLDAARAALRKARRSPASVTDIALNAGYENLSRFCRDYRARFGETPSVTMRNG